jgi:hypothetical protein
MTTSFLLLLFLFLLFLFERRFSLRGQWWPHRLYARRAWRIVFVFLLGMRLGWSRIIFGWHHKEFEITNKIGSHQIADFVRPFVKVVL